MGLDCVQAALQIPLGSEDENHVHRMSSEPKGPRNKRSATDGLGQRGGQGSGDMTGLARGETDHGEDLVSSVPGPCW